MPDRRAGGWIYSAPCLLSQDYETFALSRSITSGGVRVASIDRPGAGGGSGVL